MKRTPTAEWKTSDRVSQPAASLKNGVLLGTMVLQKKKENILTSVRLRIRIAYETNYLVGSFFVIQSFVYK